MRERAHFGYRAGGGGAGCALIDPVDERFIPG